jgi:hypothetical protein
MKNAWITHTVSKDIFLILFPWVFGVLLLTPLIQLDLTQAILLFLIFGLLDSGHVYTTIWRFIFGSEKPSLFIIAIPVLIFCGLALWLYFQIPYFWAFIVYSTLFHHIRQYFGITKWYQKINNQFSKMQGYFVYILTIVPIILYHLRSDIVGYYYTEGSMFLYANSIAFMIGLGVYLLCVLWYIGFEIYRYKQGLFSLPSFLSVIGAALLYAVSAFAFTDVVLTLSFLILGHTIPYLTLMILSVERTAKKKVYANTIVAIVIIFSTALLFGGFESIVESSVYIVAFDYLVVQLGLFQSILISLFITPLMTHFAYDAIVWTRKNKDMKQIVV